MNVYASSNIATPQQAAVEKGPSFGPSGFESERQLRLLEASVTLPIGTWPGLPAPTPAAARLGVLRKGSRIVLRATELSSDQATDIAGSLIFTPVDGSPSTQVLPGVSVENNVTPVASIAPTTTATPTLEKDCWVDFVPASASTSISPARTLWARIVYSVPN